MQNQKFPPAIPVGICQIQKGEHKHKKRRTQNLILSEQKIMKKFLFGCEHGVLSLTGAMALRRQANQIGGNDTFSEQHPKYNRAS
jgi:hypothetical protein